jgi:hypothetical protein
MVGLTKQEIMLKEQDYDLKLRAIKSDSGKCEVGNFIYRGNMIFQLQPEDWPLHETDKYERRVKDGRTLLVVPIRQVPPLKGAYGFNWFGVGNAQKIL